MADITDDDVVSDVLDLIPALRAYARALCRNGTDADDLVQDTLVKALCNLQRFEPGTRLRAWLFTIMRNTFYTNISRRMREPTGGADCVSGEVANPPTQEWAVQGQELFAAINRLPAQFREALVLVVVFGESYEDAARICDCAIGTIKSRISRARQLIIDDLQPPSA